MFEFNVSKDMQKKYIIKKMILRKITAHLCLTLIVEQVRVVTTLNIIKHYTP